MKNIMITGASSGIGEATARYLNKQEDVLLILVARNKTKLQALSEEFGENVKYIQYDLNNIEGIENIFLKCKEWNVKLDGLVHCAGVSYDMPIRTMNMESATNIYNLHVFAFMELGKHFGKKKYSNDDASVVTMSSLGADILSKGMCAYSSSKAAVNSIIKIMGKEMLGRRIRVNAVAPAYVNTPMVDEEMLEDRIKQGTWLQELGMIPVEQVVYLIDFLLSKKSSYITGAVIPISGGIILK